MPRALGVLLATCAFLAAIAAGCSSGGQSLTTPAAPGSALVIHHGLLSRRVVALTFDAGYPGPDSVATANYTKQILDTLESNGIRGSIAMTGVFAEQYPDLLRRMVSDGDLLMNHSYHHWHFVHTQVFPGQQHGLTQAERWDELDKTDALVEQITGVSTKPYFRPPYGDYDASVDADVYKHGYRYNVLWGVDSRGWQGVPPDQIIPEVIAETGPGSIILFHLGVVQDTVALPAIIDGLRAKGYTFATVAEMIPEAAATPATPSS